MRLLPNELVLQQAIAYYKSPEGSVEVAQDLKEKLDRWQYTEQLIRRHGDISMVIGMLIRKYSYSESSARRDINAATYVHGSLAQVDVVYWQRWSMEKLIRSITKAEAAGDYSGHARLNKEFRETVGINKQNAGIPLPGQLQRNTFIIGDDYVQTEDAILTREDIEQKTMELLAKYKSKDDKELQLPPHVDTTGTAD